CLNVPWSRPVGLLPLLDRHVMVERRPDINLARPVDASLRLVHDFLEVGDPAGHAANGENDGEHLVRDADGPHDNAAIEIDVGVKLALEEIGSFEGAMYQVR